MTPEDDSVIRPAVVSLVNDKMTVTLRSLHGRIQNTERDNPTWKWSISALYDALPRVGFVYNSRRHNDNDRLCEKPENVQLRTEYLEQLLEYEGRDVVYMNETDISDLGKRHPLECDCCRRKKGWVEGSFRMWQGNNKNECRCVSIHWGVNNHLFASVDERAVIVMDRATYHTKLTRKRKARELSSLGNSLKWPSCGVSA